ncbi:MAG: efflux RND transporter permease subunit, partial [Desulfonatronovibrionaceae bacterium]
VLIGPEYLNIETSGEFSSIADIKDISLHLPGRGSALPLDQLADVVLGYRDPPQKIARFNSERAVFLAVNMARGGNILEFGRQVQKTIHRVEEKSPLEIDYQIASLQPEYVRDSIRDFSINLIEAFSFVVIVMFIMAGLRVGLAAGVLIPMAVLTCIALLPVFNTALQTMSIASLILALGILVDNGVVVSEDILVRINRGVDRETAARRAALRLRFPLLAASLTTIAVFLPIPLAPSITGEYTTSLAIVVSLTLLSSWVYCQTLVPLLCSRILKPKRKDKTRSSGFRGYAQTLVFILRHRTIFLLLTAALTATAFWGFQFVPRMFFPPNERDQFTIDFWQPYGTDIRITEKRAARLEKFLLDQPETVSVSSFIGTGGPRWYLPLNIEEANTSYASLAVKIKDRDKVDPLLAKCKKELDHNFPDTRYTLKRLMYGPPTGTPIQVRISGDDIRRLYSIRDKVTGVLKDTPGVISIWDDWGEWTKKLVLDLDQNKARRIGLSTRDVARSVQLQMGGITASDLRVDDESIPIVVRSQDRFRTNADKISGLNVYPEGRGHAVPLLQVADPELTWQPSNIRRRDQTRTMTVKADISGRFASQVLEDIRPAIWEMTAESDWPQGYSIEFGGEFEKSSEARASIMLNMPLALGILLLILVLQFNSVYKPLIILLTLPPMMCGITPGMIMTNSPFGFMAMLGLISLLGIIVNNAIILINQIDLERTAGVSTERAIVNAALKRTRPILMTAITTVMGMIPLSLQGGELWRPMANCIISGLAVATLLTLGLCPVLYSIFYQADFRGFNPKSLSERG